MTAKRDQILDAALKCFDADGFHRTSMATVIDAAGVSAGTVYRYFPSKTDLIRACADEVFVEIRQVLGGLAEQSETAPPEVVLRTILDAALRVGTSHEVDLSRVGVSAWAECLRDPELMAAVNELYTELRSELVAVASRWVEASPELDAEDAEHIGRALFGALPGFIVQRLLIGDVEPASYARGIQSLGRLTAS